jgi:hypothetical protein
MLPRDVQSIFAAILIAPLPMAATAPRVGAFIAQGPQRTRLCLGALILGFSGLAAWGAKWISLNVGLCFFAPLWEALVVMALYRIWHRFSKRPPVDTFHNWNSGLFWDRTLALAIMLIGIFPFLFVTGPKP